MLRRIVIAVLIAAQLPLAAQVQAWAEECQLDQSTSKFGFGVSARCGVNSTTAPIQDSVKKSSSDPGTSTNHLPPEPKLIPRQVEKTCDDLVENCPVIADLAPPAAPPAPGAPPAITTAMLREAATRITLPPVQPEVGPDPSANQWGVVAVGYPIWLWAPGPGQVTSSVTTQGITVAITATRTATAFDMGDGTILRCTRTTPYPGPSNPPAESPTCGHRYQRLPSSPGAGYTVRATSHWAVAWSALGQSGTFTMTRSATRHLDVAELQSVITAR